MEKKRKKTKEEETPFLNESENTLSLEEVVEQKYQNFDELSPNGGSTGQFGVVEEKLRRVKFRNRILCATISIFIICCVIVTLAILIGVLIYILLPAIYIQNFSAADIKFQEFSATDKSAIFNYTVHVINKSLYNIDISDINIDIYRESLFCGVAQRTFPAASPAVIPKNDVASLVVFVVIPLDQAIFTVKILREMELEYRATGTIHFEYDGVVEGKALAVNFKMDFKTHS